MHFNPIIVLFLTPSTTVLVAECPVFQSYYSLIFNTTLIPSICILFLFQSYYSLIFNFRTCEGSIIFVFQSYYSLIFNDGLSPISQVTSASFQSYYSLIFNILRNGGSIDPNVISILL